MSEDRRGAYRNNAFTVGAVETPAGAIECLVWDIHDAGALIEIDSATALPDTFRVSLSPDAVPRNAAVAWRRGNRVGLSFA